MATPTVALSNDTGSSGSDNIPKDGSLSFSAAAADVPRSFTVDGGLPSASYTAPAADGAHTVVVTDTDTAGNIANASTSVTADTSTAATTASLTTASACSTRDRISTDSGLSFSPAAEYGPRNLTRDSGPPAA